MGIEEAFDKIVRKYAKEIYNLCYRLCGNYTEADDLSQEVLLRAYQSIKNFKQESGLSTWLHRIAVNLWIDNLRMKKEIKYVYIDEPIQSDDGDIKREITDFKFMPENTMKNKELEEIIKKSARDAVGVGVVEAPRGTLYHMYKLESNGTVKSGEVIVPTGQNQINIEEDIYEMVERLLPAMTQDQIQFEIEKLIRAYDPCMSCAAHFLKVNWS